jgi:TolB-like protein/DNA-binding winged helix-turn-helix (wHTH) protein
MGSDSSSKPASYRVRDLVIDEGSRRVTRNGDALKLGGLTFDLLLALIECAPNVASHDELAERIWNGRPVTPETVAQRAKMLRDALSDDAKNPRYFEPVRGHGYRLCSDVEPILSDAAEKPKRSGLVVGFFGLAAIALIALVSVWLVPRDRESISLAVLPMESFAEDIAQQVFADELTEELYIRLAPLDNLRVTPSASSFAFKGSNQTIREFAAAVGVEYVLTGSVRKLDDTIRISAQLIRTRDESHRWSATFERDLEDLFLIHEEIALAVADVLEIALGVGELGTRPGMTRNVEAYQLYLQALQQLSGLAADTERSVRAIVTLLERAIEVDPDFAIAWFYMARTYGWGIILAGVSPDVRDDWASNAADALRQALEIAPDSVEIAAFAAEEALQRGKWFESWQLLSDLIDNVSKGAFETEIQKVHGIFLKSIGSPRAAVQVLEQARTLDPLDGLTATHLGDAYLAAGNFEAALDEFDRGLTLQTIPGYMLRGSSVLAALASGDEERIKERLTLAATDPGPGVRFNLAMLEHIEDPEAAVAVLRRIHHVTDNQSSLFFGVSATFAAHFGDAEYALELLNNIPLPDETGALATVIWRPSMADVRALPGFIDLLEDMGLAEFWRAFGLPEMCGPTVDDGFSCR